MKKLLVASLALLIMSALIFSGCAQQASPQAPVPSPTSAPAPVSSSVPATDQKAAPTSPVPSPVAKPGVKVIDLSLATQIATNRTRYKLGFEPWIKKIQEATGGKVSITTYPAESLCKVTDSYDAVVTGIAKIAEANHDYTANRFPLSCGVSLPGLGMTTYKAGIYAMRDLYEKFPEIRAEYSNMHLLWNMRQTSFGVNTVKKPIRTLEDIKGMRIRTAGGASADSLKAVGAIPVFMGMGDVYTALQKGTLDGNCSEPTPLWARHLYDAVNYHTFVDLGSASMWIGMNLETWNSLPQDVQKVFNDTSQFAMDSTAAGWDAELKEAYDNKPVKFEYINLSPEESARFDALTSSIAKKWVQDNKSKGPTQGILDEMLRLAKVYRDTK